LYSAVRRPPICSRPVGLGAKRTRTSDAMSWWALNLKDEEGAPSMEVAPSFSSPNYRAGPSASSKFAEQHILVGVNRPGERNPPPVLLKADVIRRPSPAAARMRCHPSHQQNRFPQHHQRNAYPLCSNTIHVCGTTTHAFHRHWRTPLRGNRLWIIQP